VVVGLHVRRCVGLEQRYFRIKPVRSRNLGNLLDLARASMIAGITFSSTVLEFLLMTAESKRTALQQKEWGETCGAGGMESDSQ
jgi:hypothetical protein